MFGRMGKNLGTFDRIIRFIAGIILIYLGYFIFGNNVLRMLSIMVGLMSIFESFISYCGIYRLFNINTHKK